MSENTEDLGLDEILEDEETTPDPVADLDIVNGESVLETEVVENEAGEVMFDPNRVVSDEEAAETLAASADDVPVPEQVGEVAQVRLDPDAQPMTDAQRHEARAERKRRIREKQIAADKQLQSDARAAKKNAEG